MPFRTVLCLCASAVLLAAADQTSSAPGPTGPQRPATGSKKDFLNPNLGALLQWSGERLKPAPHLYIVPPPGLAGPGPLVGLANGSKQCSIPLKWAKVQPGAADPRGEIRMPPHAGRVDPMYGSTPAPVCTDSDQSAESNSNQLKRK